MPDGLYDSLLVLSFGGPEREQDVLPFLENVLRGRNVPRERMLEVAEHYYHFGGRSPINDHNRELVRQLEKELSEHGPDLPVYWGNRNWHPFLVDTLRRMRADGRRRALVFVTSAFSSYSGCRQYLEDLERARAEAGAGVPETNKLRVFYNHPLFISAQTARIRDALAQVPAERRASARLIFTAHSVPLTMASSSDYVKQLEEAGSLVSRGAGVNTFRLAYQSRSGPPTQPWLEPDILDVLRETATVDGSRDVVVVPLGFLSDHMEVLYDLDTEARQVAGELGVNMIRAGTAGGHPDLVRMIRELILERTEGAERRAAGRYGPEPDTCRPDCCRAARPPVVTK